MDCNYFDIPLLVYVRDIQSASASIIRKTKYQEKSRKIKEKLRKTRKFKQKLGKIYKLNCIFN